MPQVLEAPEIQGEERSSLVIEHDQFRTPPRTQGTTATTKARWFMNRLRSVFSALTKQAHEYNPEFGALEKKQPESAFDYVYRIDPYVCIRAFLG